MNVLEQLKKMTRVVADTGDFESMVRYRPVDATTNPSLIYAAAQKEEYSGLVSNAIAFSKNKSNDSTDQLRICLDKLAVDFGLEILKIVEGRVSTEVDARLSFDTKATIDKARELIILYESAGVDRSRILIKVASTWEGIRAAELLEKDGIHCNLTLLFGMGQALACADAGVTLISPFVGRIYDWYKKNRGVESIPAADDPGVLSVRRIYNYYKKHGYETEVMGASFRNTGEIVELAGCDLLTISPQLLHELENMESEVTQKLSAEDAKSMDIDRIHMNENDFRWMLNEDAMATEKLAEGIRNFTADLIKLEDFLKEKMQ